jgi:hypothetical protein
VTHRHFDRQLKKIRDAYPTGLYDETRIELIWNAVQNIDEEELAKIVNHMISAMRQAPIPLDFIEAVKSSRRYASEKVEKRGGWPDGLQSFLESKGCKSLKDAVRLAKQKIKGEE